MREANLLSEREQEQQVNAQRDEDTLTRLRRLDDTETTLATVRHNLATLEADARDTQLQLVASREREQQLRREYLALSDSVSETARAMTEQQ
jgi:hypothetical protein